MFSQIEIVYVPQTSQKFYLVHIRALVLL